MWSKTHICLLCKLIQPLTYASLVHDFMSLKHRVILYFLKNIAKKFAYMQFLLYLCTLNVNYRENNLNYA